MTKPNLARLLSAALAAVALTTLGACGTTAPDTPAADPAARQAAEKTAERADAEAARATVKAVIAALEARDAAAFKAHLSAARAADYSDSYFETWVSEIEEGADFQPGAFERGSDSDRATVEISFRAGSAREKVPVRLAREDGTWRWDER